MIDVQGAERIQVGLGFPIIAPETHMADGEIIHQWIFQAVGQKNRNQKVH